jgi:S1-C subfamily serine protease
MKKYKWSKIMVVCFTVSLIVGMIGGALTNEYFVAYVFDSFVKEREKQTPIVKKVIEEHSYVEESKTIDAINIVQPALTVLAASDQIANRIMKGEIPKDELFKSTTSDSFYLNRQPQEKFLKGTIPGGSGFLITSDGLIATCSSLVSGQKNWSLITSDEKIYHATVVFDDPYDDFSLLKITDRAENEYFKTIEFAENNAKNGQKVLSMGKDVFFNTQVFSSIIANEGTENSDDAAISEKRIFPNEFVVTDREIDENTVCGPAVNLNGEIIGMSIDFDSIEPGRSFVIPVEALKEKFYEYQEMVN